MVDRLMLRNFSLVVGVRSMETRDQMLTNADGNSVKEEMEKEEKVKEEKVKEEKVKEEENKSKNNMKKKAPKNKPETKKNTKK